MDGDPFDLWLLFPFVALAEEHDRGRAAERCGLTCAELADQVGQLEQQVGTPLFEPAGSGAELTPAGGRFLAEARDLLEQVLQLEDAVQPVSGELRVHLGFDTSPRITALAVSFAAAHTEVGTRLVRGSDNEADELLERGEIDVVIGIVGRAMAAGVRQRVVERSRLGVMGSVGDPAFGQDKMRWSDLDGRVLMFSPPGTFDAWSMAVRGALHRAGVRHREVTGPPLARSRDIGPALAERGALVVAPDGIADRAGSPRFAWVPLDPPQFVERALTWRRDDAVVRLFVAWVTSGAQYSSEPVPSGDDPGEQG